MKITTSKNTDQAFKPVSFSITCESQAELDAWRALFNHAPFLHYLGIVKDSDAPRHTMDKLGADKKKSDEIWQKHLNGVTFDGA